MNSVRFSGASDGDRGPYDLSSGGGWHDVCSWAETLPDDFALFKTFAADGNVLDTIVLANELGQALDQYGQFLSSAAKDVAERLYTTIGPGDAEETAWAES